jgi:hypothetical protein
MARSDSDEAIQTLAQAALDCFADACNDERPENEMTKVAFDKIKSGLEDAKACLDGLGKQRDCEIRTPAQKKK